MYIIQNVTRSTDHWLSMRRGSHFHSDFQWFKVRFLKKIDKYSPTVEPALVIFRVPYLVRKKDYFVDPYKITLLFVCPSICLSV